MEGGVEIGDIIVSRHLQGGNVENPQPIGDGRARDRAEREESADPGVMEGACPGLENLIVLAENGRVLGLGGVVDLDLVLVPEPGWKRVQVQSRGNAGPIDVDERLRIQLEHLLLDLVQALVEEIVEGGIAEVVSGSLVDSPPEQRTHGAAGHASALPLDRGPGNGGGVDPGPEHEGPRAAWSGAPGVLGGEAEAKGAEPHDPEAGGEDGALVAGQRHASLRSSRSRGTSRACTRCPESFDNSQAIAKASLRDSAAPITGPSHCATRNAKPLGMTSQVTEAPGRSPSRWCWRPRRPSPGTGSSR